jgi:glucose-6-phosphate 1-dehydrogenase
MHTKLIIFGITGDLSRRKLLPVISEIVATGDYDDLSIVGVSRREVDVKELLIDQPELINRTEMFTMDLAEAGDYNKLSDYLRLGKDEQALFYLSVPPNAAADIVDFLGQAGLSSKNVKILFEKPFGFDLASAQDFITRTGRYFNESQIYRIDHYMAKEIAQEIIRLRSDADTHHHSWNAHSVASVDVVASETLGVEDRAVFYEQTGALRDFIQGHLMQLLSLVLMEIPHGFNPEKLSEHRLKALEQLELADPAKAIRAQYEGYQEEVGNPGSLTETFASLQLESDDERWKGTKLRLSTGKRLDTKQTSIKITYHDGKEDSFEEGKILREDRIPDAYERVLIEAIEGRKTIFTTGPEVLRAWEIVTPVQEAWSMDNKPLPIYEPGASLDDLIH